MSKKLVFNLFDNDRPIVDFTDHIMPNKTRLLFDFIIFFVEKTQICLNLKILNNNAIL